MNLYPFRETVLGGKAFEECVENIDIGGPAMIRAAAKNHPHVSVVVDPNDYDDLLENLKKDGSNLDFKKLLAWKAFQHCASYDASVAEYLCKKIPSATANLLQKDDFYDFVERVEIWGKSAPTAAVYSDSTLAESSSTGVARSIVHHGKEMSYNNYLDAEAAYSCACDYPSSDRTSSSSTRIRVVLPRNLPPAVTCWSID